MLSRETSSTRNELSWFPSIYAIYDSRSIPL
jgi:hypothetical protein